ncbi:MAG TPA: TolC family protein, partial [Bdellovibrionales bacterium]|nr:TolC family protein [Bdellovibrionales bacterium]
ATYGYADSRDNAPNAFTPQATKGVEWKVGVRDKTQWGLGTDIYTRTTHTTLIGVNRAILPLTDYYDSPVGIELTQRLWRDGFGSATRAGLNAQRAASRSAWLRNRFELKNLMLRAENTYWSLVSLNQIVKLQEENVARAKKLMDYMRGRSRMKLVDDVDSLQAQAALESRELELMASLDERAVTIRAFNTLRGGTTDDLATLPGLPADEILLKSVRDPAQRMSREDFSAIYQDALAIEGKAQSDQSQIAPQLDLKGGVFANALNAEAGKAYDGLQDGKNPNWYVGVAFSIPLDYSLLNSMRRSYKAQRALADHQRAAAEYQEQRVWDDLNKQREEAQRRYQKAISAEEIQTTVVNRERQRMMNGRTTTFQLNQQENALAATQILRVRSQLALLASHNVLKQFEVQK